MSEQKPGAKPPRKHPDVEQMERAMDSFLETIAVPAATRKDARVQLERLIREVVRQSVSKAVDETKRSIESDNFRQTGSPIGRGRY